MKTQFKTHFRVFFYLSLFLYGTAASIIYYFLGSQPYAIKTRQEARNAPEEKATEWRKRAGLSYIMISANSLEGGGGGGWPNESGPVCLQVGVEVGGGNVPGGAVEAGGGRAESGCHRQDLEWLHHD